MVVPDDYARAGISAAVFLAPPATESAGDPWVLPDMQADAQSLQPGSAAGPWGFFALV